MRSVTVVGASIAGVSAVQALREQDFKGEIVLIDGDTLLPYDRPPLSKQLLRGDWEETQLLLRPREWYEQHGVTLRLGRRVDSLDVERRVLRSSDGAELSFDGLIVATGSTARNLTVPVERPDRMHRLRTCADSRRLRSGLVPGRHLVIIGGGFIGLEAAAVARSKGLRVTVVETADTPMQRVLGTEVGRWFQELHQRHGVDVLCGVHLVGVSFRDGKDVVELAGGTQLEADIVLVAVGAAPACDWLDGSGLRIGDGLLCNPDLSTGVDRVVAAGDAVRWDNPLFEGSMRIEHWTNAVEQANHAVSTLLGRSVPFTSVPYFWSDQYDAKARFVGLSAGHQVVAVDVPRPGSFVALFGSGGQLRGALCVNLPRRLAQYRDGVRNHMTWEEAVRSLPLHPSQTSQQPSQLNYTGGLP